MCSSDLASKEMKHILLHYLDYCNCTQPFTLTIDYLRVRFPTTDALEIIKNVLAMKSEYFIHEDYGMFGYEEQLSLIHIYRKKNWKRIWSRLSKKADDVVLVMKI